MRDQQQERRAAETAESRGIRLQVDSQRPRQRRLPQAEITIFDQPAVKAKIQKFHSALGTLGVAHAWRPFLDSMSVLSLPSARGATMTTFTHCY